MRLTNGIVQDSCFLADDINIEMLDDDNQIVYKAPKWTMKCCHTELESKRSLSFFKWKLKPQ